MRALHGKFAVVREAESKLKAHTSRVGCTSKYVFLIIEIYSRERHRRFGTNRRRKGNINSKRTVYRSSRWTDSWQFLMSWISSLLNFMSSKD